MESPIFSGLVFVAFVLLITVSGGIVYLTFVDWRDRRRRDRDKRGEQVNSPKVSKADSLKVSKASKTSKARK